MQESRNEATARMGIGMGPGRRGGEHGGHHRRRQGGEAALHGWTARPPIMARWIQKVGRLTGIPAPKPNSQVRRAMPAAGSSGGEGAARVHGGMAATEAAGVRIFSKPLRRVAVSPGS